MLARTADMTDQPDSLRQRLHAKAAELEALEPEINAAEAALKTLYSRQGVLMTEHDTILAQLDALGIDPDNASSEPQENP